MSGARHCTAWCDESTLQRVARNRRGNAAWVAPTGVRTTLGPGSPAVLTRGANHATPTSDAHTLLDGIQAAR